MLYHKELKGELELVLQLTALQYLSPILLSFTKSNNTSYFQDSSAALTQLQTSPHGHINYSTYSSASATEGLLTTVASSSQVCTSTGISLWLGVDTCSFVGNHTVLSKCMLKELYVYVCPW